MLIGGGRELVTSVQIVIVVYIPNDNKLVVQNISRKYNIETLRKM